MTRRFTTAITSSAPCTYREPAGSAKSFWQSTTMRAVLASEVMWGRLGELLGDAESWRRRTLCDHGPIDRRGRSLHRPVSAQHGPALLPPGSGRVERPFRA